MEIEENRGLIDKNAYEDQLVKFSLQVLERKKGILAH